LESWSFQQRNDTKLSPQLKSFFFHCQIYSPCNGQPFWNPGVISYTFHLDVALTLKFLCFVSSIVHWLHVTSIIPSQGMYRLEACLC
jgi:hypothetical protein